MSKTTRGANRQIGKIESAKATLDKLDLQLKEIEEQKKVARAAYEIEIQKFFEPFNKWLNEELYKRGALNKYSLNELQEVITEHYLSKIPEKNEE